MNLPLYNPNATAAQSGPAQIDTTGFNQDRAGMQDLLGQLRGQLYGSGPNPAMGQQQAGLQDVQQRTMGMMAGNRSANPGLALYGAQQGMAGAGQAAAGQANQSRLAQMLAAQQGMAGLYGQMQGADLGLAQGQAGLNQQSGMFNAGQSNDLQAQLNQLMTQQYLQQNGYQINRGLQQQQSDLDMRNKMIGGAFQAGAGAAGFAAGGPALATALSDERAKQDVRDGSGDVREMLRQLRAHNYEYTDPELPGASEGRHVSVMAQELERSELGKRVVSEGPDGLKRVDYAKAAPSMLAALADLHRRTEALETRKGA